VRTTRTTIMAAVAVLLVVGCTGDDAEVVDEAASNGGDAAATPEEEETTADGATVIVREFSFQEPSAIIAPDTRVTWDNQDSADHTVTSGTPNEPTGVFDEELPAEGELTIVMDEAGTYPYYCRIHPQMVAELVVEPAVS